MAGHQTNDIAAHEANGVVPARRQMGNGDGGRRPVPDVASSCFRIESIRLSSRGGDGSKTGCDRTDHRSPSEWTGGRRAGRRRHARRVAGEGKRYATSKDRRGGV